jgi:2-dehydro-3-deoxygluconokinase
MARYVTFGEVMLRLKPQGFERLLQSPLLEASFGGAEANVAVGLAHLGLHAVFVSAVPPNQIGDRCIGELRRHGVDTSFVRRGGNRLGIYFLESGAVQRPSSIIYDRSGSALSEIGQGDIPWDEVFSNARWFHISGITPAITASTAEVSMEAVERAKVAGVTVSCDLNYRKKLWKYGKQPHEVMEKIVRYADIVVGNEEDYQRSLSMKADIDVDAGSLDPALYARMTEQVLDTYPNLRAAAVTLRTSYSASHNRWQAVLRSRDRFYMSRSYEVQPIVDRVGSGDAFAAGLIFGLSSDMDDAQGLEFATAAGCLKHSIPGDFLFLTREEVSDLSAGGGSGRIQR